MYIHPSSKKLLESMLADLPQSVLFTGPTGIGFGGILDFVVESTGLKPMIILPEKDEKIDLEKGTISVDVIRRLHELTRSISDKKRLIVIDYVETMAIQAQNAFLKLLEEPGKNTHFILMTHAPSKLLPTIHSRVSTIEFRPTASEQSEALLNDLKVVDATKKAQLLFIAKGLPAELHRLAENDDYFAGRVAIVRDARTLLSGSLYDRLKIVNIYKDSRDNAQTLLIDATKQLKQSINDKTQPSMIKKMTALLHAYDRIGANGNVRLQLARIVI
jgi:DNA polymerase-3 subunit delta'